MSPKSPLQTSPPSVVLDTTPWCRPEPPMMINPWTYHYPTTPPSQLKTDISSKDLWPAEPAPQKRVLPKTFHRWPTSAVESQIATTHCQPMLDHYGTSTITTGDLVSSKEFQWWVAYVSRGGAAGPEDSNFNSHISLLVTALSNQGLACQALSNVALDRVIIKMMIEHTMNYVERVHRVESRTKSLSLRRFAALPGIVLAGFCPVQRVHSHQDLFLFRQNFLDAPILVPTDTSQIFDGKFLPNKSYDFIHGLCSIVTFYASRLEYGIQDLNKNRNINQNEEYYCSIHRDDDTFEECDKLDFPFSGIHKRFRIIGSYNGLGLLEKDFHTKAKE
ncbi:hypothetical protein LguiB_018301 [Lonicera macranthoides]